jgi:Cu(I)/Ag(I) efflux system membrane fusion protein
MPSLLSLLFLSAPAVAGDVSAQEAPVLDAVALLGAYDAIRVALVADSAGDASAAARSLAERAPEGAATGALAVADAPDLAAMRLAFGDLSRAVVLSFADAPPDGLHVYRCPMVSTYAYWLQADAGLQNPYMGTAMPECGEGTSLKAAAKAAALP